MAKNNKLRQGITFPFPNKAKLYEFHAKDNSNASGELRPKTANLISPSYRLEKFRWLSLYIWKELLPKSLIIVRFIPRNQKIKHIFANIGPVWGFF